MSLQKPLGYMLAQTIRVLKNQNLLMLKEAEIGISLDDFIVLLAIDGNEYITQQNLSDHLMKDKSLVLRQVNALIDKRFVVRLPDEKDKRKKNLLLTKKGFDTLVEAKRISQDVSSKLLLDINEADLLVFEKVLTMIQLNGGLETDSLFGCL